MTNDQIWHQSTVMERCEILRSRLDSLWTMGPPTVKDYREWVHVHAPSGAIGGVTADEVERWKRIEAAAKLVLKSTDEGFSPLFEIRILREALRS